MPRTRARLQVGKIAAALLVLAVLALTGAFMKHLLQPRDYTVAEVETHLKRTEAHLKTANRVLRSADSLSGRMGSTNSLVRQKIQSLGQSVIQKLERQHSEADVRLWAARVMAAADRCVHEYNDFNQAQEAMAALLLAGIKDVVIRPPARPGFEDELCRYKLMVPHDVTVAAVAALRNTQIRELKRFRDAFDAIRVMRKLEGHGIHAIIRPLQTPGRVEKPERLHVLYVLRADKEAASTFLEASANVDDHKF